VAADGGNMNQLIGLRFFPKQWPARLLALLLLLASSSSPALGANPAPAASRPQNGIDAVLAAGRAKADNQGDFLPPDVAWRFTAIADGPDRVRLVWEMADGYYLYRTRIKAETASDHAQLGAIAFPAGQIKQDEYFGRQEVYHHQLIATLPVARAGGAALDLPVKVTYQGCADAGLCYPPIVKTINVSLPDGSSGSGAGGNTVPNGNFKPEAAAGGVPFVSEQDRFVAVIRDGNIVWVILSFLVAGIGLSFTPCVLPMVPIVSGLIIGDGMRTVTTRRSFILSLVYVLGMALTYTAAGMAVAAGGSQVQAIFQQPWIIITFSALFIVLAASMFGLFTLQMPAAIQTRLANVSNRQSSGTYYGVAIMGALSALIVTTCVAPALVGALVFIGQSGNMARGGAALFSMGIGMGTPLLVVGASAGTLLPRAGAWMELIKHLFGALMLGVAAWMLSRITPERYTVLLWVVPIVAVAAVLWIDAGRLRKGMILVRIAATAFGILAAVMALGAYRAGQTPFSSAPRVVAAGPELPFRKIKSVDELQRAVADAKSQGKPVLLDFYADWCTSCKEMERYTFTDSSVQSALRDTVLLRADVTANDAEDQALLHHFGIFGPPTIALYSTDGQERTNFRVVGYMKAADFAALLHQALTPAAAGAQESTAQAWDSPPSPTT
jgi:thioredoxin:protein disulfide reductase